MNGAANSQGYRVDVVRSGDWWAITVPSLPGVFSQARRLAQVPSMAREAIAMMLGINVADVGSIEVDVQPPEGVADLLTEARQATAIADEASATATDARRRAARLLHEAGLPMREIGELVGVSHQRVSQILAEQEQLPGVVHR